MRLPSLSLLLFLEGCAGPDEVRIDVGAGRTDYDGAVDLFDSDNYGASLGASWDVGTRAEASRALINLHQEIARRSNLRDEAVALDDGHPPTVKTESNQAEVITAIVVLLGAIAGWWQRNNLGRGVKSIAARVTKKKEAPK